MFQSALSVCLLSQAWRLVNEAIINSVLRFLNWTILVIAERKTPYTLILQNAVFCGSNISIYQQNGSYSLQNPKISVIIPTYNRYAQLHSCLCSIFSQSYSNFEVIVVDGDLRGNTIEVVKHFPVKYVPQAKKGHVSAYNLGVKYAAGDILAFIDDDCIAHPEWLSKLLEVYRSYQNVGGVGGKILTTQSASPRFIHGKLAYFISSIFRNFMRVIVMENKGQDIAKIFRSGLLTANFDKGSSIIKVDHLQGCNMSFKKETIKTTGSFDDGYGGNGFRFEADFCIRAKKKGFNLYYTPFAIVKHNVDPNKLSDAKVLFYMNKNDLYFFFKNLRPRDLFTWLRFLSLQFLTFVYLLRGYLSTGNSAFLYGIYGKINGFFDMIALRLYP